MPVSLRKSLTPKARRKVPAADAMRVAFSMPRAVSMRARIGMPTPARIEVRVTCSGSSVFGSMMPRSPGSPDSASRSSSQWWVHVLLTRTQPTMPSSKALTTLARAVSFWSSGTAASRSKMMESASLVCPDGNSSGLDALTKSHERDSRAGRARARLLRS